MYRPVLAIAAVAMLSLTAIAQEKPVADAPTDKGNEPADKGKASAEQIPIGYFLGLSMGQQLRQQGLSADDFKVESIVAGMTDALADKELEYSSEQIQNVARRFQQLVNDRFDNRMEQIRATGEKWLQENLKKEGVKELTGGLQYKVLKEGDGGSPTPSDNVRVHYTGRLINGEVFDSSVQRGEPAEFVVGQVIKGWQMALQKMQVGDKWMLYIPPELAYGERGSRPAIGPNEVLIFEVELLDIL